MGIPRVILPHEIDLEKPALDRAFAISETDTAPMWIERCRNDLAQLWNLGDFWIVTEVIEGKSGRIVRYVAAEGVFSKALFSFIEDWARSIGCKRAVFTGRKGWLRRMRDYKFEQVTMTKEL